MTPIEELKMILLEDSVEFFTDEQLNFYLNHNGNDLKKTAYQCLLIKSDNTTLQVSGLTTTDTSNYFKRLASRYKPRNSGILKGGY